MAIHLARSLVAALQDDRCLFGYAGRFPDEHSPRLIELGEAVHCSSEVALSSKGRLGYVLVEAYQNIVRHHAVPTDEKIREKGRSMFLLQCRADGHTMITRNPVTYQQKQRLEERLTELRGKDTSELKELFLESIQRPNPPGTRGAGLGLIEMVRRAGANPQWSFDQLDQSHFIFNLALGLGDSHPPVAAPLKYVDVLAEMVLNNRMICFYTGFSNTVIQKAVLGLVREELLPEASDSDARFSMAGEMAEILSHMIGPEGAMTYILQGGDHPMLSMGGELKQAEVDRLRTNLQDTDVQISTGTGVHEGSALVMVHIPW